MPLLSSCWLIIEATLIPDSDDKFTRLGYFTHPVFLIFCQFFILAKDCGAWVLIIIFLPVKIICSWVGSSVQFIKIRLARRVFHVGTSGDGEEYYEALDREGSEKWIVPMFDFHANEEPIDESFLVRRVYQVESGTDEETEEYYEALDREGPERCTTSMFDFLGNEEPIDEGSFHFLQTFHPGVGEFQTRYEDEETEQYDEEEEKDNVEQFIPPLYSYRQRQRILQEEESSDSTCDHELDRKISLSSSSSSSSPLYFSRPQPSFESQEKEELRQTDADMFYNNYKARMKVWDLINLEKTCLISAVLNKSIERCSFIDSIKPRDISLPDYVGNEQVKDIIIRNVKSLRIDFEHVYVGQLCLSWDALHHQYSKVEELVKANPSRGYFQANLEGKFRNFNIILENFMDRERVEGERFWNYVQSRSSIVNLLQVPEVSGYVNELQERSFPGQPMTRTTVLLKIIQKSINVFERFVRSDDKSSKMFKLQLRNHPRVDNPNDLGLLADLREELHKKKKEMEKLLGKKKCLFKNKNSLQNSQKWEVLFCEIDLMLISRVLKMCLLSTNQLNWCKQNLSNIEILGEKLRRNRSNSLFPLS